jgi:hypothetical protein
MRLLHASLRDIDLNDYKNRSAKESDCSVFVKDTVRVVVNGQTAIVYITGLDDPELSRMAEVLPRIHYAKSTRTNGLVTTSRIFGYAPRNELRGHPCRAATFAADQPHEHATVAGGAVVVARHYRREFPELSDRHDSLAKEHVRDEYRIAETMFTSGIVNHNNPLRYHFDSGNFRGVCSAMLGIKHKVRGGFLCVPELDLMFEISDRSLLLFDGQALVHGVTPIEKLAEDSHRFTVVYYSLQQMWNCDAITDEIARLRAQRTNVETKRAKKDVVQN